jgi:hypothetical protein
LLYFLGFDTLMEDHDISMEDMQPAPQASRKPTPQASPTIQNPAPQAVAVEEIEVDASRGGQKRTSNSMEDMQPAPQASPTIQNPAPQASGTAAPQASGTAHVQPVAEDEMEVDASRGTKRTSKVVLESGKKKKVANDEGGLLLLAAVSVASPPNAACNNTVNGTLDFNQAEIMSNDPKEGSVEYLLHEFGSTLDNIIGDSPLRSTDPTRIIAGVASTAVEEEALSTNKVAAPKSTTGTKMTVTKRDKTVKAAKPEPMVLRKGTKK